MKKPLNRILLVLALVFGLFFVGKFAVLAITVEECESKLGKKELTDVQLDECNSVLSKAYKDASDQKVTLQNEITKFNTAVAITATKIIKTTQDIAGLEKEITALTGKIGQLDTSLDQLSQILIKRISETYKKGRLEPIALLFSAKDFTDFVSRYKYLRVMQINDRKIMTQMEDVRTNFADQKTVKEQKQTELEAAKKKLEGQKRLLAQQKADKENLLKITNNNEQRYQELLKTALAELSSLRGFTAKQAGGILPAQESPDGWFYSQRDERWANKQIGYSSENIFDVGCLISSVAMIFTYYGQKTTPADIAGNTAYFFPPTAYMRKPWPSPSGKSYNELGSLAAVDEELNSGRPVIVHLALGGDGHFVVLKKKEGDDYIMHDPWNGYDKKFKEFYTIANIDKRVVYK